MKAKPTLSNIISYLQGNARKILLEYYPDGLDKHIEEQYYWRIKQVQEKSPECLEKGKCKICSCDTPELFMADKACEGGCYPEMMSEEWWDVHKEINEQLELFEKQNKIDIEKINKLKNKVVSISKPIIIRDLSKEETLADLMQNNPNLTKEELLYWCPEFKEVEYEGETDDTPGIKGTQFKVKLSKDQFSGNMTSEQIEDIAKDLGFYDSGNIQLLKENKE